ncbi:MAG: hypothetical protein EPN21_16230 [Methylococcaceae bacterium]|nr:MAG: hypothetical protein EPN21_16230 [Methylococcaceae bacterium]
MASCPVNNRNIDNQALSAGIMRSAGQDIGWPDNAGVMAGITPAQPRLSASLPAAAARHNPGVLNAAT